MKAPSRRSSEDSLEIVISPSANSCTYACTTESALHHPCGQGVLRQEVRSFSSYQACLQPEAASLTHMLFTIHGTEGCSGSCAGHV